MGESARGAYTIKTSYVWGGDQFKFDLVYIEELMTTLLFVYHKKNPTPATVRSASTLEDKAFQNLKNKYFGPTELIVNPTDQLVAVWNFPSHVDKKAVRRKRK